MIINKHSSPASRASSWQYAQAGRMSLGFKCTPAIQANWLHINGTTMSSRQTVGIGRAKSGPNRAKVGQSEPK